MTDIQMIELNSELLEGIGSYCLWEERTRRFQELTILRSFNAHM
ncbi:hypothetical protein SAMN05518872_10256 [Psychrobacillus sp. OK032]|nr:hypothetical protein SAMN05518872_10256 [Psychrobacillus sp. OK032]